MKKIFILILLFSVFILSGCGNELNKYSGIYKGKYMRIIGDIDRTSNDEFYIELKSDGTGKNHRDGEVFEVTWSIDGKNILVNEAFNGITSYHGTIEDNGLKIYNGDSNDLGTFEYVYEKSS